MNTEEFLDIFSEISSCYPNQHYSEQQTGRLFLLAAALSKEDFSSVVASILDSGQRAPTIDAIKQACMTVLTKQKRDTKVYSDCTHCMGSGISSDKHNGYVMTVACSFCDAADLRRLSEEAFPRRVKRRISNVNSHRAVMPKPITSKRHETIRRARGDYLKNLISDLAKQAKEVSND